MMNPTGTTRKKTAQPAPVTPSASAIEVLTLGEAAKYLRVSEEEVVRLVQQQALPGRLLGTEWRFLTSALREWLQSPPARGSKEAVLSVGGAWKDDSQLEAEVKEIYKRRGRPSSGGR